MAYNIVSMYVASGKYSLKCPYSMTPQYITVHNTANDASARNEVTYMRNNGSSTSFHVAVDDKEVVLGVPFNRNAFHAGDGRNGTGNRKSIGIEICYSKSGGSRFDAAERNAAAYIASLLKTYGWGLDRVKRHYDWSGKDCPHRTIDYGWQRFLGMVASNMGGAASTVTPSPVRTSGIDVKYRSYANGKWWPEVINFGSGSSGYAGVIGRPLLALEANTVGKAAQVGKLKYRLRRKNGRYFGWHTDRERDAAGDTFAGNKKTSCDRLQMTLEGAPGYAVRYRVYAKGCGWLAWITDYNNKNSNGYAGINGREIQAVQIQIVKA